MAWSLEERRRLATLMSEAWMTMIFRHGFFHGDPHPANIMVLGSADDIGLVDFGAAGKLTDEPTRDFIRQLLQSLAELTRRLQA